MKRREQNHANHRPFETTDNLISLASRRSPKQMRTERGEADRCAKPWMQDDDDSGPPAA